MEKARYLPVWYVSYLVLYVVCTWRKPDAIMADFQRFLPSQLLEQAQVAGKAAATANALAAKIGLICRR